MRILRRVALADLLDDVSRHDTWPRHGARWTRPLLDHADTQFGGVWHLVALTGHETRAIVLPPHAGEPCHGDRLALIGEHGPTVEDAAAAFAAREREYRQANRECWSRIDHARVAPLSRVVLTAVPLDHDEYRTLAARAGALYHLDGLHRLIAWCVEGRLTEEATLEAYVAGVGTSA